MDGKNEIYTDVEMPSKSNEIKQIARFVHEANVVGKCDTCEFFTTQKDRLALRSITIIFYLLEMIVGIACFAVEVGWEICSYFLRYYVVYSSESNVHRMVTRTRFIYTITTAIPFIFVPLMLISLIVTRKFCIFSLMSLLLSIFGCAAYLACGIIVLVSTNQPRVPITAFQGLGGLYIGMGCLFFGHAVYEAAKLLHAMKN